MDEPIVIQCEVLVGYHPKKDVTVFITMGFRQSNEGLGHLWKECLKAKMAY